jgi:hypothetical protein
VSDTYLIPWKMQPILNRFVCWFKGVNSQHYLHFMLMTSYL